ncbi:hypothetical protein TBLA_0J01750 [Henningerozyma blattae CBS 6284]|uniref:Uncharacterized protein n=1 Tax=Henningerozyma blattae (strain ATCC 34711 / CBS 6284 / DSM 70876 / NBRC 10599 / NRRL Y-10934 / UCD 77-7) TaxID=1071380 RepID=I2H9W7_HENB6|nr:hypothetical protein TBLA_0J01750 [Tetrapisispora blattae CBS 6284]CCH63169.1 hypothetical protein TBLA_0J01750 [Tetrapisispora blattae CBS 6284]
MTQDSDKKVENKSADISDISSPQNFAQAWKDIQKGELQADELERKLDLIESQMDEFLKQLDSMNPSAGISDSTPSTEQK